MKLSGTNSVMDVVIEQIVMQYPALLVRQPISKVLEKDYRGLSLVFDIETTGLNPALDRVCEIAVILTDWRQVYAVLRTYVDPGFAFENVVNGLTLRECGTAPTFRELVRDGLFGLFALGDEYVTHNGAFDIRFLSVELSHLQLRFPLRRMFDTFGRCRRSLPEACAQYKIDTSDVQWHSALGDCVATFRLAQKLRALAESDDAEDSQVRIAPRFQ